MAPWNFQPRLLPQVLDQDAARDPDRLFCIHSCSLRCADHGWRRVTVGALACAVDNFAWWMEKTVASRSTPQRLVYLGPNDIRYTIFMLACMKLGHCVGGVAWKLLRIKADQRAPRLLSSPLSHRKRSLTASYDLDTYPKYYTRTSVPRKHKRFETTMKKSCCGKWQVFGSCLTVQGFPSPATMNTHWTESKSR